MLWSESWQLPINLVKDQLLPVGTFINVHTYHINGITILSADKVLDLGIITDNDLSYSSHISSLISKARSSTGIILKSFFSHNISLPSQAYITFVRPIISQVWNQSVLKYISDFENLQRNFTYRIRSTKHLSYPGRLTVLTLELLELLRLKADLVMYYSILNNLISINFDDHFTIRKPSSISTRSTGPSQLKPFSRTNRIVNNFFSRSINIWNA